MLLERPINKACVSMRSNLIKGKGWSIDEEMNSRQPVENKTGEFYIYDPIFWNEFNEFCCVKLENVKKGIYVPFFQRLELDDFDERIMKVGMVHIDNFDEAHKFNAYEDTEKIVGIDTAMVVISDALLEEEIKKADDDFHLFFKNGIICDTGIGDGTYNVYAGRDSSGQIMSIVIDFSDHPLLSKK